MVVRYNCINLYRGQTAYPHPVDVVDSLMPAFEVSKILPCDLEEAWQAVVDFPSRTIHSKRYRRADLPDGDDPAPGHRILLHIGRDRFTSIVTGAQKPGAFSHRAIGPGFWAEYSYRMRLSDESDPGYTNEDFGSAFLVVRGEYGGWLGSLVAKLRPGACRRYVEEEMAAIFSAAESVRAEPVSREHSSENQDVRDIDG